MAMIRKVMPAQVSALGDDEVEVIISTGQIARDGHIFEPAGAELDNYRKNPIVLWQHDPMHPVGRAEDVRVAGDKIVARIKFAPTGISHKADEVRGLVKSGIVSGISVGMDPIDAEPIDPKKPRGGQRVMRWEMLECSFCSVPVDTQAMVTARAEPSPQQETAMDEKAAKEAREREMTARRTRMLVAKPGKPRLRGLCEVASLAWALENLGYVQNSITWEADIEKDGSAVPGMLGEALKMLGEALVSMTAEEVAEMIAALPEADDEAAEIETRDLPDAERAFIAAGTTPQSRAWRRGIALRRAGRTISASNQKRLEDAQGHHDRAMKHSRALGEHHEAVGSQLDSLRALHGKAADAHADIGTALGAAKDEPEKAADHVAAATRAYRALGGHLDDMKEADATVSDRHQDIGDAHRALDRSVKSAQRVVRSVIDGSTPGEDSDSKDIQVSKGETEGDGSAARSAEYRRRQADILALSH